MLVTIYTYVAVILIKNAEPPSPSLSLSLGVPSIWSSEGQSREEQGTEGGGGGKEGEEPVIKLLYYGTSLIFTHYLGF